jgi:uncharacterized protein (DUF58 family)
MPVDVKALMKQVGEIRMVTKRLVDEHLSGEYHSVFKGQGIEFDEVREYAVGDDIRSIDWNVSARMGHPYVKRFAEERELTVMFVVDISGSQCFGSGTRTKAELAAEITCLLALSAIQNQDKVGLILFSDRIEKCIPPRKGRTAAMRLVREVLAAEETRHGIVFVISDFLDRDYQRELRVTARKHDIICCPLSDPREAELPDVGLLEVEDPETRDLVILDTGSAEVRQRYAARAQESRQLLTTTLRRLKVDAIALSTDRPFIDDVRRMFKQRQHRFGRG